MYTNLHKSSEPNLYTHLNAVGTLPFVKLNEGRLLGSKATVGVEVGGLKLNPPVGVDVDDCNITTLSIGSDLILSKTSVKRF